jgi:hypothetical protein
VKTVRNEFVAVAEDCPAVSATEPPARRGGPTLARLQFDLLTADPYRLTLDELDWAVHLARTDVPEDGRESVRDALLAKGRPCMRASPLTKLYGWGAHYDEDGRIGLHPIGSERYRALSTGAGGIRVTKAMRTRRA